MLAPLAAFDNAVDAFMRATFGVSTGLLLSGTGVALVLAYVARFLGIANGGLEAGLGRVPLSLDMAARNLGDTRSQTMWRIHLPLIRPALGAAALLVFVAASLLALDTRGIAVANTVLCLVAIGIASRVARRRIESV